ncbi:MAG: hypothetical protein WBN66_02385 [Smithella sp.]
MRDKIQARVEFLDGKIIDVEEFNASRACALAIVKRYYDGAQTHKELTVKKVIQMSSVDVKDLGEFENYERWINLKNIDPLKNLREYEEAERARQKNVELFERRVEWGNCDPLKDLREFKETELNHIKLDSLLSFFIFSKSIALKIFKSAFGFRRFFMADWWALKLRKEAE